MMHVSLWVLIPLCILALIGLNAVLLWLYLSWIGGEVH